MNSIESEAGKEKLLELLTKYKLRVTTAESCTGGMVASGIVDISGISEFFHEGFVTYSDEAKIHLLHVEPKIIETFGIVSIETAEQMAIGACQVAKADCSVTTTGVAGPSGGTIETPVGCVCFGCSVKGHVFSERIVFSGDRKAIREEATCEAFRFLIEKIEEVMI